MALRDQPYLPLYVQDFLTDEKLMECSAQATGVFIRLMCIMHKSDPYGTILLKQKDKQNDQQILNFANKLAKHLPYSDAIIIQSLTELVDEGVLRIEGDSLFQKRMVQDNNLSNIRSEAGKKGVFAKSFASAKPSANTENENESNTDNDIKKGGVGGKKEKRDKHFYIDKIISIFQEEYKASHGLDYEVTNRGKERDGAGKLLELYKKKYPKANSDEMLQSLREYLGKVCEIRDDWIFNSLSLNLINSQFNRINSTLKNGNVRRSTRGPVTTDAELAGVIARGFTGEPVPGRADTEGDG